MSAIYAEFGFTLLADPEVPEANPIVQVQEGNVECVNCGTSINVKQFILNIGGCQQSVHWCKDCGEKMALGIIRAW